MFTLEIVCSNLSLTDGCNSRKNHNLCPELRVGRAEAWPSYCSLCRWARRRLCACGEVLKHWDYASDLPWHCLFSIRDASSFSVLSEQLWPEDQAHFGLESKETRRKKCMLVWFVLVASRFPMALPCPCVEQALRDGVCGGGISFTLALGTLGLYLLPKNIPAPRGLCLNCECCCVNTAGRGAGSACTSCERASPANPP